MTFDRYEKFAPRLSELGYDTTPLKGKIPVLKGWQTRPDGAKNFRAYGDANIGVLLGGAHNLIAVDIDVRSQVAASYVKGLAVDILGAAPERIGNAPKTMLIYRAKQPTKKVKTAVYEIDGMDACVELLAEGQQVVVSGIHPDGMDYAWPNDKLLDYRADELPAVDAADMEHFLAAANTVLGNYGEIKSHSISTPAANGSGKYDFATSPQKAEHDRIFDALACIPNDELHYDDWAYFAHAIKGACGDGGLDLFHGWSQRSNKYDSDETDRMWRSIGDVKTIGAGTIFHQAAQNGYKTGPDNFGPGDLAPTDEFDEWADATAPQATVAATPDDGDFTAASVHAPITPRMWVIADWVPYKTITMLFGAGGVGKTLLGQQAGNCVATGRPFLGLETMQMPVISISCEDDKDELSRRQLSINAWMGIDEFGSGPENMTLSPRVGKDNILVTFSSTGKAEPGEFFQVLCDKISRAKGDAGHILVLLDTAADLFGGTENSRRETNTFIKTYLGSIVQKYNATIILMAHPSLAGIASGTGLSGSTAWENSVRARAYLSRADDDPSIRTLARMKSNYSDIGSENDIKLIWDNGVLTIPSTSDQLDRLNNMQMKHDVMAQVDIAWRDKNPFRARGGRSYKEALPATLRQHKRGAVVKAFNDLVSAGNVIHVDREGFKTEKSL